MKKVLIFGTFDLLHQGHINLFEQARKHGDYLIAVIARDQTLKETGKKPAENEKQRRKNVSQYVDKAVLGNLKDKYAKIKLYKPSVICLGYDQEIFTDYVEFAVKKYNLKTKVVRLNPFKQHIYKSSFIRKNRTVNKK